MGSWFWMSITPKAEVNTARALSEARRTVLAQWRGVDLTPLEQSRKVAAKPAGQVLSRVLASLGLDRRRTDAEIVKAWSHLIDPNLTAHAQPTNLAKGTLFITVDSSAWLDEIVRYRRKEILARLQHCFGRDLIVRLSCRVG